MTWRINQGTAMLAPAKAPGCFLTIIMIIFITMIIISIVLDIIRFCTCMPRGEIQAQKVRS